MKKLLLLASLILIAAMHLAAAQGAPFDGKVTSLRIGGNVSFNATVVNPLPIDDTLMVVFAGDAITQGLVTPFYGNPQDISCNQLNNRCQLQMNPNEEKDIRITIEGTAIGQETLTATVNSSTTQLSSSDRTEVRVRPYFGRATFSAPGIQGLQVAVIGLVAALAAGYFSRD